MHVVTMDEFLNMLFSEVIDLWWGEGGRVGLLRGKVLQVRDFDADVLARAIAARIGGRSVGSSVEVTPARQAALREPWFLRLLERDTTRAPTGDGLVGTVGPVRIVWGKVLCET